jgi:hypothetical protein
MFRVENVAVTANARHDEMAERLFQLLSHLLSKARRSAWQGKFAIKERCTHTLTHEIPKTLRTEPSPRMKSPPNRQAFLEGEGAHGMGAMSLHVN